MRFLYVMFCARLGRWRLGHCTRVFSHHFKIQSIKKHASLLAADISLRKTRLFTAAEKREVKRLQQAKARVVRTHDAKTLAPVRSSMEPLTMTHAQFGYEQDLK